MENINIEEYIQDLSPEIQEKARACKDIGEIMKMARENRLQLPDEVLEAVAGGKDKNKHQNKFGEMPIDFPCFCTIEASPYIDTVKFPYAAPGNIVYAVLADGEFYVYADEHRSGSGMHLQNKNVLKHYSYPMN